MALRGDRSSWPGVACVLPCAATARLRRSRSACSVSVSRAFSSATAAWSASADSSHSSSSKPGSPSAEILPGLVHGAVRLALPVRANLLAEGSLSYVHTRQQFGRTDLWILEVQLQLYRT